MTWDPAEFLRGDVSAFRDMDPLERARFRGEQAEEAEQRQAERRQAERREKTATALAMMEAAERQQIMARGYTDRELRQFNAENQARTDDRVAELEAELNRLDPARRRVQAQRQQQASQQAREAVTLMRARRSDEFMRREVARMEARADRERSAWLKDEIVLETVYAAREAGRSGPEISR